MLFVRLLKSRFYFFLGLAMAFFSLAFGLEIGRSSVFNHLQIQDTIRPSSFCPDGTEVKTHAHHLEGLASQALFELGRVGRATLKNCLCQGFGSGECTALKMEIGDRMD